MSEILQETDKKSETYSNQQLEGRSKTEISAPSDLLSGSLIEIVEEFYNECIEFNLQAYPSRSSSNKSMIITPKESSKTILKQPSEQKELTEKTSSEPSLKNEPLNENPASLQPNLTDDIPLQKEPSQIIPDEHQNIQLSRQSSKAKPESTKETQKSKDSLAFEHQLSKQPSDKVVNNISEDIPHEELQDTVAPLTERSKGSRPHSIKERDSRKQFDEPMRVSFAEPENLVNRATESKPLLNMANQTSPGESDDKSALSKRGSVKPILVREDSYLREKRMSCNRYTSFLVTASKNVTHIVKGLTKAMSKPQSEVLDDEAKDNLGVADVQNFSRSALDDYHADSSLSRHRDSLKLSRCASMNKSFKKTPQEVGDETNEILYDTRNFQDDDCNNTDVESGISNLRSLEKISIKKSCMHKAKSGDNVLRPVVSFVLPFEQPEKKAPLSYQDISSKNRPPLSPTRFPGKKTSQFNKKSSLHQIEEAFFNRQGVMQGQDNIIANEDDKGSQHFDLRTQEVMMRDTIKQPPELQISEDKRYGHRTHETSLRESGQDQMTSSKKISQNASELLKAKQATELILKINLEKQARHAQMERRQQQELLRYQKQVLESQKILQDTQTNELRNSRVEKILENIKHIQKRGEDRRKANSKSNHVIKRIQDTVVNFYQKPSTIELAEEQRRAIILEKIKSQHRPIDANELDQHQKLYEECALLMRAELANKRKIVPERLRQSEDKPHSNNVIRRIVERETEIEAQNREVSQMIKRKNQLLESAGVDLKRSRYRPDRMGQSPQEYPTGNGIEGMLEDRSMEYKVISKAIPMKNYSSRLKQTIASSLQISPAEQQELMRSNYDNRLPVLTDSQNPSSFGKQSFYFSNDVYEAYGMRYAVDAPQLSRSNDAKVSLVNSQRLADSRFKENKPNPVKISSRLHTQQVEKHHSTATSMENKTTLPKINRGITQNGKSDPLNPWKSIK